MMRYLFTLLLSFPSLASTAQTNQVQANHSLKLSDFYLLGGFVAANQLGSIDDFRQLAPGSVLLQNNFSSFNSYEDDYYYGGYGMFSVLAGFNFRDREKQGYKANPQIRLGFSYFTGTALSNYLWDEVRTPWDTVTSSQTGHEYFVDSVVTEYYDMDYKTEQALLEASLIYRTKPEARWCLYGGLGFAAGFSLNATTHIDHYKNRGVSVNGEDPGYYPYPIYYSSASDNTSEFYRNKTNFSLSLFVPLGIDFRIARKSEFWQKMHLFYEMRPGLLFTFVPEMRTISNGMFQSTFGLRVEIR